MSRAFILTLMILLAAPYVWASNVILIDSECVMLEDIFPNVGINEEIYCGLDYGEEKTINRQMAIYIINKYNIQGARAGEVTFRRNGTLLTENRLRRDLAELLSVMYSNDVDVEIGAIRMSRDFYFSDDKGYEIDLPKGRFGNISVSVDNGIKRYSYTVSLTAFKEIYVTKGHIRKGDEVEHMVTMERYDLSKVRGEPVTEIKGYIATRNLSAGRPLTSGEIMQKPDALEGTTVMLVYKTGGLNLSTSGELLEDAYVGKNVRVKNVTSGKIVRGEYSGDRKVYVNAQ